MPVSKILFFLDGIKYRIQGKKNIIMLIREILSCEKRKQGGISIILCSDRKLLKMNKEFLDHDYYTDVIAFNYNANNTVSGDIYISLDRVKDNAKTYKCTIKEELFRVIVHGVLHLCGYNDKKDGERRKMTEMENFYLRSK